MSRIIRIKSPPSPPPRVQYESLTRVSGAASFKFDPTSFRLLRCESKLSKIASVPIPRNGGGHRYRDPRYLFRSLSRCNRSSFGKIGGLFKYFNSVNVIFMPCPSSVSGKPRSRFPVSYRFLMSPLSLEPRVSNVPAASETSVLSRVVYFIVTAGSPPKVSAIITVRASPQAE